MPLYPRTAQPYQLYEPDILAGSSGARSANGIYWQGIYVPVPCVVTGFRVENDIAGNGHIDMGLYDDGGNLLCHVGSTASVSGTQTISLAANYPVSAGRYWMAFWVDNALDTSYSAAGPAAGLPALQFATNAGGLPATMASVSPVTTSRRVAMAALIDGGWS